MFYSVEAPHLSPQEKLMFTAGKLLESRKRADHRPIWEQALTHENPPALFDDFEKLNQINWPSVWVNTNGGVIRPPRRAAAALSVADNHLILELGPDPDFEKKSNQWIDGLWAAPKYNNVFTLSRGDWLPTPTHGIRIECSMAIEPGTPGSTGIWLHDQRAFNQKTGLMKDAFLGAGFSFLGKTNCEALNGLAIETVVGWLPQKLEKVKNVDPHERHLYQLFWYWVNKQQQAVEFYLDEEHLQTLPVYPFGPAQVQLWHDNYWFPTLKMNYLNPPKTYRTVYDLVQIEAVRLKQSPGQQRFI
jgi:hypothetical protein